MSFKIISTLDVIKPKRTVTKIFIHCTAADDMARGLQLVINTDAFHRRVKGWNSVGYHYMIDKNGVLMTARDVNLIPAAQAGHNDKSLVVCLQGLAVDKFTEAQFQTLRMFNKRYNSLYKGVLSFHGHCEVSAKSCPVFDYREVLRLTREGYLGI